MVTSLALPGGVTRCAVVVWSDAVAMYGTEPAVGPLVFYGGFQLGDLLFEFIFFGDGKSVASAATAVVVSPTG